ncbi:uncharacterized protein B0T15DRAFT_103237 [Chaetomium strumarium]|uniref:Peptide hydrolase n=1 Tax=Chaetomium strumarium TaxID=1170767 RepID=A0AAJ0GY09_9PEZI|nr:hypothetical protein B0T15DRAFT_103237 [Chaetomium strumarium]
MINPFSFRPGPVTFWTTVTYLALLIPIIIVNEQAPPVPSGESPVPGINLTQAWLDLATVTRAYHPYNSRYNDELRKMLLQRIRSILDENGVAWTIEGSGSGSGSSDAAVTVFDDMTSNCTFLMASGVVSTGSRVAAYFEGTNILVYIRGKADDQGKWWNTAGVHDDARRSANALTLVNAHYDSVSTGYGATDDGMGVVTCLQLIQYFTRPGNQPERGIVVTLNNGEEDYLYGARALGQHPLQPYIHTFLNLEGAGAGGRALLFRTTDREVTAAYARTPGPFGTVIGSDAFGLGFIRSGTDYSVLYDVYGQRGLDLAFFKPRARYHTNQDDARHASRGSLWHMLSASIHTTTQLSRDSGDTFVGPRPDGARGKVRNGRPSDGVWFDLFGKGFVLFGLRGMFAWSLTVLIATPLILALVSYILHRADRYYLFSSSVKAPHVDSDGGEPVQIGGWKGFFRFPFALVVVGSLTLGAAFLLRKVNPFIVYSSRYSVLAMMVSLFYFSFWAIMRGANFARPSALHRVYVQIWLFILGWAMLVAVTVAEDRLRIGAGYMFVFFQSAVFLSVFIALCELFALPKKATWSQQVREDQETRALSRGRANGDISPSQLPLPRPHQESTPPGTRHSNTSASATTIRGDQDDDDDTEAPTERTPLVGGNAAGEQPRTTFATTYRQSISALVSGARRYSDGGLGHGNGTNKPFEHEQAWSGPLPSWTWLLQFLLLGPFTIILIGQIMLMLVDATHQTGADGSSLLLPYLIVFLGAVVLFLPLTPFIHRITHHIPVFLLLVFAGTLIYNLAAFPFSANNRYKTYFVQTLDLDGNSNSVCYAGIEEYVRHIIAALPSAAGKDVVCAASKRQGLVSCCFDGADTPPRLTTSPSKEYRDLITVNATRTTDTDTDVVVAARIEIAANNTKACFLEFDSPVSALRVRGGSGWDERFGAWPEQEGVTTVRLWHREWDRPWVVDVEWKKKKEDDHRDDGDGGDSISKGGGGEEEEEGEEMVDDYGELGRRDGGTTTGSRSKGRLAGHVVCMWSDVNVPGTIPALDEALAFVPAWAAVTKLSEGLVEGRKRFEVS